MLVRPRLLERLGARWYVPVVVVSAPAGYAKTTLLSQAVAANAVAPLGVDCWLACGPDDAAASSLGEGLARAVGAAASTALSGPTAPDAESGTDLAVAVSEAMWQRTSSE
jgi:ATP/maltotriose-dependent transcriptional regulator MalT